MTRVLEFRRVLASDDPEPHESAGYRAAGASHFHEGEGMAVLMVREVTPRCCPETWCSCRQVAS